MEYRNESIAQSDQNSVAVDSDLMAWRILGRRHAQHVAISNIEFGSMARAYQTESLEFTVTECPTVVRTKIFDAVDVVVVTDEDDKTVENFHRLHLADLEFLEFARVMEFLVANGRSLSPGVIRCNRIIRIVELGERSMLRGLREPIRS